MTEQENNTNKVGRPATGRKAVRYSISIPPEIAERLPKKGASKKIQKILLENLKKITKI